MKIYETVSNGNKLRFEYDETKSYPHVNIYRDEVYWGVPQGNCFMLALLKDIEKLKGEK